MARDQQWVPQREAMANFRVNKRFARYTDKWQLEKSHDPSRLRGPLFGWVREHGVAKEPPERNDLVYYGTDLGSKVEIPVILKTIRGDSGGSVWQM